MTTPFRPTTPCCVTRTSTIYVVTVVWRVVGAAVVFFIYVCGKRNKNKKKMKNSQRTLFEKTLFDAHFKDRYRFLQWWEQQHNGLNHNDKKIYKKKKIHSIKTRILPFWIKVYVLEYTIPHSSSLSAILLGMAHHKTTWAHISSFLWRNINIESSYIFFSFHLLYIPSFRNVLGKFTCTFTPPNSNLYIFPLFLSHAVQYKPYMNLSYVSITTSTRISCNSSCEESGYLHSTLIIVLTVTVLLVVWYK